MLHRSKRLLQHNRDIVCKVIDSIRQLYTNSKYDPLPKSPSSESTRVEILSYTIEPKSKLKQKLELCASSIELKCYRRKAYQRYQRYQIYVSILFLAAVHRWKLERVISLLALAAVYNSNWWRKRIFSLKYFTITAI